MRLKSQLAKGCMQGKDRSTHAWVLLLTPWHPSESLLEAGRCAEMLPVGPMKAVLISSVWPVLKPCAGQGWREAQRQGFGPQRQQAWSHSPPLEAQKGTAALRAPGLQAPQPWQELAWRCARRHLTEVDFSVWAGELLTSRDGASQSYLSPRLGFGR